MNFIAEQALTPCCLASPIPVAWRAQSIWLPAFNICSRQYWVQCSICGKYQNALVNATFCNGDLCRSVLLSARRLYINDPAIIIKDAGAPIFLNCDLPRKQQNKAYGWIIAPVPLKLICLICRALQANQDHRKYLVCIPSRAGFFGVVARRQGRGQKAYEKQHQQSRPHIETTNVLRNDVLHATR